MLNRLLRAMAGPRATAPETDVARTARARAGDVPRRPLVRLTDVNDLGSAPGALHIPLGDLGRRMGELRADRPVITVCRSGRRSLTAAEALLKGGFADAVSLAGGMIAWNNAKQPVESSR